MSEAYFESSPQGFVPRAHARGPWSDRMMHGRLLGAMAARALERDHGADGLRPCRLTVDLFKPAGLEPVQVTTSVVRAGRRIKVVDALVSVGAVVATRATAVFLAEGGEQTGIVWQPPRWEGSHPESLPTRPSRDSDAWDVRVAEGGFGTGERSRVWTADKAALVEGEEMTPFVRAATSADLASPLSNAADDGLHYINADYTMALARLPVGCWVGLDVAQHVAAEGLAVGSCTLYDLEGAFGTSTTTALANPPLLPEP